MIRLIQRRLIIPRGDTGSFSIPVLKQPNAGDIAVFTIFDCSTRTRMFQKQVAVEGDTISIAFTHTDTVNLKPGKYFWDIKFYTDPVFVEDELVDGVEVDSYYAAYSLPDCEIRETADNYLVAPDGPDSYLTPEQLDIVTEAIAALQDAITKTETNVTHYPQIRDGVWYVWDAEVGDFVSTDSHTPTKVSELENDSGYLTTESDPTVPAWAKQATKPAYTASEVGALPADTYIPQKTSDLTNDSDFAVDANYVHTDNNYTTEEKTKLNSIAEGAEVNVNADWDAAEGDAAILHKPTNVSAFENDAGFITIDEAPVQDVQVNGTSILDNRVANIPIASNSNLGVVKVNTTFGIGLRANQLALIPATSANIQEGAGYYYPIGAGRQHESTFYGLAKIAGVDEKNSALPAGQYTDAAKAAIQTMLDVPSNADVAAKQDILTFDSAPTANSTNPVTSGGVYSAIANVNTMKIHICGQDEYDSETGMPTVANPDSQSFYLVPGGADSNLFIEWVYVDGNWERFGSADVDLSGYALKSELPTKVSQLTNDRGYLTSYTETDPTVPQWAKAATKPSYTAAEVGALPSDTHIPSTTAELTNDAGFITGNEVPVQDVQVAGTSIVGSEGVANIPKANATTLGVVLPHQNSFEYYQGALRPRVASTADIKTGTDSWHMTAAINAPAMTYYGLSKVAGVDLANETVTLGAYPETSKTAIKAMLGVQDGLKVVRLI